MKRNIIQPAVIVVLLSLGATLCSAQEGRVKFKVADTGHQLVQVNINGRGPYWMVFDTGAQASIFTGGSGVATVEIGGVKGTANFAVGQVRVFSQLRQMSPDMAQAMGMLGYDFYRQFCVTIDYQRQEMIFSKALANQGGARIPRTTPARSVTLGVTAQDGSTHGARIVSVLPGSAAEKAGLQKDDLVVGLGWWWVDDLQDFGRAVATLEPGKPATIQVIRAGKGMALQITPRAGL